jgi:hypothetical protein
VARSLNFVVVRDVIVLFAVLWNFEVAVFKILLQVFVML